MIKQTPDLSGFNGAFPKPLPKGKKAKKPLGAGKKTKLWEDGRTELKQIFRDNGITVCEVMIPNVCKNNNYLGFAHKRRRNWLTEEQLKDPHYVVLACNPCHDMLDFKMPRDEAEELMDKIIENRGW